MSTESEMSVGRKIDERHHDWQISVKMAAHHVSLFPSVIEIDIATFIFLTMRQQCPEKLTVA